MWPHSLLFVHLGISACIQIVCLLLLLLVVVGVVVAKYIPGNTFQSADAVAWRGKVVKKQQQKNYPPLSLFMVQAASPPQADTGGPSRDPERL